MINTETFAQEGQALATDKQKSKTQQREIEKPQVISAGGLKGAC